MLMSDKALEKKFYDLYSEIDWLDNAYRSCVYESSGLFMWKKIPGFDMPSPYFRLESESNVKKITGMHKGVHSVGRVF
jgi:hypothetical protein